VTRFVLCLVVCLLGAVPVRAADRAPLVAAFDDAFITHQSGSDVWSMGSASLELVLGFDTARQLSLRPDQVIAQLKPLLEDPDE